MPRTKLNSRIPISIVFSILFSHTLWSQEYDTIDITEYICHYNYEYQTDSMSTDSRKQADMCLYIGNKHSKFEHSVKYLEDSLMIQYKNEAPDVAMQIIWPQIMGNRRGYFTSYSLIKTNNSTKVDLYELASKKFYHLIDEVNFYWNISSKPDTTICGIKSKEATTSFRGRAYRAWFAMSIPINDGPYKFKGLPGLIVKIVDQQNQHSFELTSFEKINYEKPILLQKKKRISLEKEDYVRMKQNESLDRLKKYGDPKRLKVTPAKLGSIEAKILSRNNFIERF